MKIYIDGTEVRGTVMPINKPTLDETLETFSFALVSNTNAEPYEPMTDVTFEDDSGRRTGFVITIDNIELFSNNPVRYKHNITCVQSTRKLSKHLIRNSVFTQPANPLKTSFTAVSLGLSERTMPTGGTQLRDEYGRLTYFPTDQSWWQNGKEKLIITDHEKILESYLELDAQILVVPQQSQSSGWEGTWITYPTLQDIANKINQNGTATLGAYPLFLRYYDSNENLQQEAVQPSDLGLNSFATLKLNQLVKYPRIKTLASQGAHNFYIIFPNTVQEIIDAQNIKPYSAGEFVVFISLQAKLIAQTYYYTGYDLLETINQRHQQEYEVEIPSGITYPYPSERFVKKKQRLWSYEENTRAILENLIAPNFTFTQLTAYECVADVFRTLDAIFTMDVKIEGGIETNDLLRIEYFNDWSGEKINPKFSGINIALSEDQFTNGLVSYYQDGRVAINTYWLPVRSLEFGVPSEEDHAFIVPYPINTIKKFKFRSTVQQIQTTFSASGYAQDVLVKGTNLEIDITKYVIEESIWSELNSSADEQYWRTDVQTVVKANSVHYSKGSNYIQLGDVMKNWLGQSMIVFDNMIQSAFNRMIGRQNITSGYSSTRVKDYDDRKWRDQILALEYESTMDGRTQIESLRNKYMGETLVDQYNGAVDLNKMGLNMLGLAMKMGEPTLTANHIISSWDKRIKTGQVYVRNGEFWIANVCSYTILPNGMLQGSVNFVKNFNALSLRTQLMREKRLSNVSSGLTVKSEDNIIDYVYVDTTQSESISGITQPTAINVYQLARAVEGTFDRSVYNEEYLIPQYATIITNASNFYMYIPLAKYGAGNSICFEMSFNHPISAGNKTDTDYTVTGNEYATRAVKYTDDEGFFDHADIKIGTGYMTQSYPEVNGNFPYLISIYDLAVFKQPNEIFALNYQICFLPHNLQNDFIMSPFINKNWLIDPRTDDTNILKFKIYYSNDGEFKYSQLDTKGEGSWQSVTNVSRVVNSDGSFKIIFTHDAIPECLSWAICDWDDNIYFASNTTHSGGTTTEINFYPRQKRL